jgi:hypothetical protein
MAVQFPARSETDAALAGALADMKAALHRVPDYTPRQWQDRKRRDHCFLVVDHARSHDGRRAFVSLDGLNPKWVWADRLKTLEMHGRFRLVRVRGWCANADDLRQATIPLLTSAGDFTDAERETWAALAKRRSHLDSALTGRKYRTPMPFGMTA